MRRSLLLFGKSLLLVLSLVCFTSGQISAQPPYILADQELAPISAIPTIQFLGFVNNCSGINFRLVVGISQFYNEVDWITDNQPTVTLPANGVFTLTAPSVSVRAQRFATNLFGRFPVGSLITLNTPNFPPFTVEADPGTVVVCPLELGETTVTSNRCVGTTSWDVTVMPFFGAPANGIAVLEQNESAGFGFDPTSSIDLKIIPNLVTGWNVYLVSVKGTETLSGNMQTEHILVINSDDCSDVPPGFQASDDLVRDFAATTRRNSTTSLSSANMQRLYQRLSDEIGRSDVVRGRSSYGGEDVAANSKAPVNEADVVVFPNPASDFITVSYRSAPVQLRILDVTGRVVRELQNNAVGLDQTSIQVSELKSGIYLLEAITAEGDRVVQKIQISR